MDTTRSNHPPLALILTIVLTSAIGLIASLAMTLEKFTLLENPDANLSCNFSVLIGCSTNLNSAQGALFGFPNPVLGLMFFSAVLAVGVALYAGSSFSGWFWAAFAVGVSAAFALVVWFVIQSIFVIGVLCPWCMLTWAATIPLFFTVVFHTLRFERVPTPVRRVATAAHGWVPVITVVCILLIAIMAQLRLDILSQFV